MTILEKDSEIRLLKDSILLDSVQMHLNRETSLLRNKLAELQADYDILKRQQTTNRFQQEHAIQEMWWHGLSASSANVTSPHSSALRSPLHSPERALPGTTD